MATLIPNLSPNAAEFPTSNFPQLSKNNVRPVLWFDATTDETCYWTFKMPSQVSGTLTLILTLVMASATTNAVGFQAQVEAITAGDAVDTDATTSFDSVNNSASTTVAGTAGHIFEISITLTNADSVAAGDYVRISLNRDADGSAITDTATGDCGLYVAELRDAA